ncbi:hypothetical protein, unknown function [Leishmania tarentolae]|uniref:Uncharacterized protein n=1 Tax=Leishmania tarentolae TaxID=5689 RepID=A0A640KBP1_LEITA|nr:hypothetical protein, unknown function [Leishmania tarentolae]
MCVCLCVAACFFSGSHGRPGFPCRVPRASTAPPPPPRPSTHPAAAMPRQSSTTFSCRNASELSPVYRSDYEMTDSGSRPLMRRDLPPSPPATSVRSAVRNGRPNPLSARMNHGNGEELDNDEGERSGGIEPARRVSRSCAVGVTSAAATTCAAPIVFDVPCSSSLAPSSALPLSHSSISETSSVRNAHSVSPGDSSSSQVAGAHKSLAVFPPRVFHTPSMSSPSTTTATSAPEALVTPPAPARLTTTVSGIGHSVTPLSSPIVVEAPSPMSPEGVSLPNQLTYFSIGGSRRRNSISVPTSPFQVDGDKAENSFMEDIAGSAGERWLVDPHLRAAPDHNRHIGAQPQLLSAGGGVTAAVADSIARETTQPLRNADRAHGDDGTASHENLATRTRSSSSPPSSPENTAHSSAADQSSAAQVGASAASAAPTPTLIPATHNVQIPPPIAVAPIGNNDARNLSLSTDHVRDSLSVAPPSSPFVSPVALGVTGGGAGVTTSPASRSGAVFSRRDSQSPISSLRFGTHDPYNTSAIVATPLMSSGMPHITSITSHHSPSATTTPIGPGITHMRVWSNSVFSNGSAGGGGGGNTVDSGATFSYCTVANLDIMSVKSSVADVSRGMHDRITVCATTDGACKPLPSSTGGEHVLCEPKGLYGSHAAPQTVRYAHEEAPSQTSTPSSSAGENRAEACKEVSEQKYEPEHDYTLKQHDVQRSQEQHAESYALSYEKQQKHQRQPHSQLAQEVPGHHQPCEPLPNRHQLAHQSECSHPRVEQPHQRSPYSRTFEPHGVYAHQASAEISQVPYSYSSQPRQHHMYTPQLQEQYDHQWQKPPHRSYHIERPYGGRGSNAGVVPHSWSGPRKRVAQDVLPGFFSVDTIQLGDQTHLVSDRNGMPHEQREQQQQQLCDEAPCDAVLPCSGSGVDHILPHCQWGPQSCGSTAASKLDNRGGFPAPTTILTPLAVKQPQQQLGHSSSVYYDATPVHSAPGDYYSGSRAGAESAAEAPSTPPHGSDDDEAMRIHSSVTYGLPHRHAGKHGRSSSVITVGGMIVAQPPHMVAPVVSRTPSQRAGYAVNHRRDSSSGGHSNVNSCTGDGHSGPSNKPLLLNSHVGGGVNSMESNKSGNFRSANCGEAAESTHVPPVDNTVEVYGNPGAMAPTSLDTEPNALVGVHCSDGDIRGTPPSRITAMHSSCLHYPSTGDDAMISTGMYVSHPEHCTMNTTAATSFSQEVANEYRNTGSVQEPPITWQRHQRHPNVRCVTADELQLMNSEEDYPLNIASPCQRRSFPPQAKQPSKYGVMCYLQHQLRIPSEAISSRNNNGYAQTNAAHGTGAMSGTAAQGASLSDMPLLNQGTCKTGAALSPHPYNGRLREPSAEAWERAAVGEDSSTSMILCTKTSDTRTSAKQKRRHLQKK